MPETKYVPIGTRVRYHGSLTEYHGEMVVEATMPGGRYILMYGSKESDSLYYVRRQSFTILEDNEVITDDTVKGYKVDTFKEFVLLEDTELPEDYAASFTVDEALTLANRLIRAANKAALHL